MNYFSAFFRVWLQLSMTSSTAILVLFLCLFSSFPIQKKNSKVPQHLYTGKRVNFYKTFLLPSDGQLPFVFEWDCQILALYIY